MTAHLEIQYLNTKKPTLKRIILYAVAIVLIGLFIGLKFHNAPPVTTKNFHHWHYIGYLQTNQEVTALLQKDDQKNLLSVKVNDELQAATIKQISPHAILLIASDSKKYLIHYEGQQ